MYEQMSGLVAAVVVAAMVLGSVAGVVTLVTAVPAVTSIAAVGATLLLTAFFVLVLTAAGTVGSGGVSSPYW
ncbi:hypothetical protein [Halorientalis sp.]|jgi:hypothetical protein|uniref:hypothetical protein n=1 Tax=Halorientalis sp. TaxID=1931229 RepID=UPI0026074894|nr:hypothetical protein [Halorientalis sp.]